MAMGLYSREAVIALEEAVGGAQKAVQRNPALQPLLIVAQQKLQVCDVYKRGSGMLNIYVCM